MSRDIKLMAQYITPSIGGMLIAGTYSIVDTFFVGKAMGEIGLAASAITWPIVMLGGAVGDMIGTGAGIIIAQENGAGNVKAVKRAFGNMFTLEIAAALLMGALMLPFMEPLLRLVRADDAMLAAGAYNYAMILTAGFVCAMLSMGIITVIRNDSRPMLAMLIIGSGLIANLVLDYFFVLVFNWGLEGAAIATVIGQGIPIVLGLIYFYRGKTQLRPSLKLLKPDFAICARTLKNGFPSFGSQIAIIAMLFMHNYQSLQYGLLGGLAAYTLVSTIQSIGSMTMTGLAAGMQPLASYFHGAGKHKRKSRIAYYSYYASLVIGVIMMVFSMAGYKFFPQAFGLTGEVAELAGRGLLISSCAFILLGVIRVGSYYFQSVDKIFAASILIYGDSCFAMPLSLIVLPLFWGMDGVWLAMPVSRIILFGMLWYFWRKYHKKPKTENVLCRTPMHNEI